jgi:hypothetical protein
MAVTARMTVALVIRESWQAARRAGVPLVRRPLFVAGVLRAWRRSGSRTLEDALNGQLSRHVWKRLG